MGELLLHLLKYVVAALVLAMGLMASPSDATWLWRRPSLLLRSLLAMYVVVPGLAFLMAKGLPLSPAVKAACHSSPAWRSGHGSRTSRTGSRLASSRPRAWSCW